MPLSHRQSPGRPRKGLLERRAAPVTVRFRIDEAAQLDLFATEAGMTSSEYIRATALRQRVGSNSTAELKHDLYRLLLAVLTAVRGKAPVDRVIESVQAVLDRLQR